MRLILTGATGLIGSATLNHLLSLPPDKLTRLYILSRSPVPMVESKPNVTVIEHKNYNEYSPELLEKLKGADGCIWAQGISQAQVSKEEYIRITLDYPVAAAKAFSTLSDSFNFVYVSGEGATQSPTFFTPLFGRTKGQAESTLISLSQTPTYSSLRPYSVRPAYVDPANDPKVLEHVMQRPDQQTLSKRFMHTVLGPPIRSLSKSMVSPTEHLGRFLTDLAKGDGKPMAEGSGISGGGWIIGNVGFRRLAGLNT